MKLNRLVVVGLITGLVFGCAMTPKKNITELYEPIYQPAYNYTPKQAQSSSAGYNVGIIGMQFEYESIPNGSYRIDSDLNKQYTSNFVRQVGSGIEKILMSKGITVSGPFDSYEEMTYPERSRCDFLVRPTVKLVLQGNSKNHEQLYGYSGPQGQSFTYLKYDYDLMAAAEMVYVIYDPLTNQKLERHKLSSDPIKKFTHCLAVQYVSKDEKGKVTKKWWEPLWKSANHPGAHNSEVIYGKILDDLYSNYMEKIDGLVSVEEFNHLKKYKDEIKEKKRY